MRLHGSVAISRLKRMMMPKWKQLLLNSSVDHDKNHARQAIDDKAVRGPTEISLPKRKSLLWLVVSVNDERQPPFTKKRMKRVMRIQEKKQMHNTF